MYDALTWGVTVAVAAILVAGWIALFVAHAGTGGAEQIDRKLILSKFAVEVIAFGSVGIAVLGLAWRTWRRSAPILVQEVAELVQEARVQQQSVATLAPALTAAAREIAAGGMDDCEDFQQWAAHLLIMWGFIGLFATTSLDALMNRAADPLPLLHPVRLLGNVTGIMFVAGLTLAMARRALLDRVRSTSSDWIFLLSLWGTGVTGFVVQWYASLGNLGDTRWSYILHIAFVAGILLFAPWSKFIHAVWRPSWALYRRLTAARR
jgi:hypothetical protein